MDSVTLKNVEIPGGVYLCQVGRNTSCGACCGLYNLPDISRRSLHRLLKRRAVEFALVPRNIPAMDAFARKEIARITSPKPFDDFHHCPYLGLIGAAKSRVGCLLHPLADGNNGIDYRGLSYYGGLACREYFCPATRTLEAGIKRILRDLDVDWYAYGLVVTESKLHQFLLEAIETEADESLDFDQLQKNPSFCRLLEKIITLKLNWPYRHPDKSLCHYFFDDGTYPRKAVDYRRIDAGPSRYDDILRELESHFSSKEDLTRAESLLEHMIETALKII